MYFFKLIFLIVFLAYPVIYGGYFVVHLQLPARQEPVVDSSKYTAADVRIVSQLFCMNPPNLFGQI